jgi:uncharacterized membrane protein
MAQNGITIAEVTAFAEKVKAALASAEQDRRTVHALRSLLGGKGVSVAVKGEVQKSRRANAEAVQTKVMDAVKGSKGGVRVGEIVEETGISRAVVQRALQRLRDAGQVKLVGEKRLAKYHSA